MNNKVKFTSYPREIEPVLRKLVHSFVIICITGPRQSGKTTLARHSFPNKRYYNLEDPDVRAAIQQDPRRVLSEAGENGAIFDEVQHYPELLSYLQVLTDEKRIPGQFVITGSYNFALLESVTQSLAGRVGLLELLPMSTQELLHAGIKLSLDEFLYCGGMPRIFHDQVDPVLVYKNYVKTYLERDMRAIFRVGDLAQFQRFLKLCASRIGSEFIANNLANELGVSYHTVQSWLSVLEASYIVFRVQPYFENFGKRIIKSSKLYFSDVGLAAYLLGIENSTQVNRDKYRGKLFENLVVLDIYKKFLNQGREPRIYFYRDQAQNEVDLIVQHQRQLIPIEIKSAQTYHTSFSKGLSYFKKIAPDRVSAGYVIYAGENMPLTEWRIINFENSGDVLT